MERDLKQKIQADDAEFSPEQFQELDYQIERCGHKTGSAIRVMSKAQEIFGYLSVEVMREIAGRLGMPPAEIYGIATFYSFFSTIPPARHKIISCQGTACYVRGGRMVLEELERVLNIKKGETTPDREFSIQSVRCMGACALAPVVKIDSEIHCRVSPGGVKNILLRQLNTDGRDR